MRTLPFHGNCFACDPGNPESIGLVYRLDEETGRVHTEVRFRRRYEGPPGHAHGGAILAVLDEAMSKSAWCYSGELVLAARLEIDYRRPIPLESPLPVVGWVERRDRRKIHTLGLLCLSDGQTAAEARGLFVTVPISRMPFALGPPRAPLA